MMIRSWWRRAIGATVALAVVLAPILAAVCVAGGDAHARPAAAAAPGHGHDAHAHLHAHGAAGAEHGRSGQADDGAPAAAPSCCAMMAQPAPAVPAIDLVVPAVFVALLDPAPADPVSGARPGRLDRPPKA